jgi:hypothetical protein
VNERSVQLALWDGLSPSCALLCPNLTPLKWWECDMWALSKSGYWAEYEIKLTVGDFKADAAKECRQNGYYDRHGQGWIPRKERNKHALLAAKSEDGPNRFWYVLPDAVRDKVTVPEWAGIRIATEHDGKVRTHIERLAPRLHGIKCDPRLIQKVKDAFYWRFWTHLQKAQRHTQRS